MKLIYCPDCDDVRKLGFTLTTCKCGHSFGKYAKDGLSAVYGGKAVPIEFNNRSFMDARLDQPESGLGKRFEAFIIPKVCPTFKQTTTPEAHLQHPDEPLPDPNEEVTFGGTIRETGVKRGPHQGIQPKK